MTGPEVTKAACSSCGKPIVWIEIDKTRIPLDPRPVVYRVHVEADGPTARITSAERAFQKPSETYLGPLYMVSHFTTCPNASAHSKRATARPGVES